MPTRSRLAGAVAVAVVAAMLGPQPALAGPVAGETIDTIAGAPQPSDDPTSTAQQPFGLAVRTRPGCTPPSGSPDPAPSSSLPFGFPACDELLVADPVNAVVRSITASDIGPVEAVAFGSGGKGLETGATAAASQLTGAYAVSADLGGLYVADTFADQVRFVSAGGQVTVIAGSTAGELDQPFGIVRDPENAVTYVADTLNDRVRAIAGDGTVSTEVTGLKRPRGIAIDGRGGLLIADTGNNVVRRFDPVTRALTIVAGTGTAGFSGDGGPARAARLAEPSGVAVSPTDGAVYIADTDNHRVRRVLGTAIDTVAGTGTAGTSPDGTPVAAARLRSPFAVAVLSDGHLVIGDTGNSLVRAMDDGRIFTLAGTGTPSWSGGLNQFAGPTAALSSRNLDALARPFCFSGDARIAAAADPLAPALILDTFNHGLRLQCTAGDRFPIEVLGDGRPGNGPDGPIATEGPVTQLAYPMGLAQGGPGQAVFIADTFNDVIRAIDASQSSPEVRTIVGTARKPGFAGDGQPAAGAQLNHPQGVAVDALGNLYIADTYNNRVRRVDAATGTISTFAGTGVSGGAGDGGPATAATLFFPAGVAVDRADPANVYVTDTFSHKVRRIDGSTGVITTIAGTGQPGFADGPGTTARFDRPWGISVDATPGPVGPIVYVADMLNHRVRSITATGTVGTLTGTGTRGFIGDQGPVGAARVDAPRGVTALDDSGSVLVADAFDNRVRRLGLGALPQSTLDVGNVLVGDRSFNTVDIFNNGSGFLPLGGVTIRGSSSFTPRPAPDGSSFDCFTVAGLRPGQFCELSVFFQPTALGPRTATVQFSGGVLATLTGNGVEPAVRFTVAGTQVAPGAEIAFGTAGQTRTLTVANTGTATLHVTGITLSGSSAFTIAASSTCTRPNATVPAGGSCTLNLLYDVGVVNATLSMSTDDGPLGTANRDTFTLAGQVPPIRVGLISASPATIQECPATYTVTGIVDVNKAATIAWRFINNGTPTATQTIDVGAGQVLFVQESVSPTSAASVTVQLEVTAPVEALSPNTLTLSCTPPVIG